MRLEVSNPPKPLLDVAIAFKSRQADSMAQHQEAARRSLAQVLLVAELQVRLLLVPAVALQILPREVLNLRLPKQAVAAVASLVVRASHRHSLSLPPPPEVTLREIVLLDSLTSCAISTCLLPSTTSMNW